MIITHKINMDLAKRGVIPRIDAVQDDKYSRNIAFSLNTDGEAWEPPEGAAVLIRYCKPDGTGGEYNALPDGSAAYSISGNVVTVALAPQVLTGAGAVLLDVVLISASREISTFWVLVEVHSNVGAHINGSDNYENLTPIVFIDETLSLQGQAVDARVTGDAIEKLSGETIGLRQGLAVERARIDGILTLPEGSTTADAELMDIRVGYDGTAYDNAGTAVRTQISGIVDELSTVDETNLCPQATATVNAFGYLNGTWNGCFGQVKAGVTYTFSADYYKPAASTASISIRNYSENPPKNQVNNWYINYNNLAAGETRRLSNKITPSADGYLFLNANLGAAFANVQIMSNIQLEIGAEATEYVEYQKKVLLKAGTVAALETKVNEIEAENASQEKRLAELEKQSGGSTVFCSQIQSVAHQGGSGLGYPQNTVENIIACGKKGWKAAEFDVRWTSDGVPVVSHDDTRTLYGSTDTITISASTYETLAAVRLYEDESIRIPTFYETIDACRLYGLTAFIEIKGSMSSERLADMIRYLKRRNMLRNCAWLSFNLDPLVAVVKQDPEAAVLLCLSEAKDTEWVDSETRFETLLRDEGKTVLNFNYNGLTGVEDLETYLNSLRDYGFLIGVWTVDSGSQIQTYLPYADYITSNVYRAEDVLG